MKIGNSSQDYYNWTGQQNFNNCQQQCERFIIQLFHRGQLDERELLQFANRIGTAAPDGGVAPLYAGKLLGHYNIPYSHYKNASIHDLMNELSEGHKVIVGVDAKELWNEKKFSNRFFDKLGYETDNHAVIVSLINTDNPSNIKVEILDPGNGSYSIYTWKDFSNAWEDSGFDVIATKHSPEQYWEIHPNLCNAGEFLPIYNEDLEDYITQPEVLPINQQFTNHPILNHVPWSDESNKIIIDDSEDDLDEDLDAFDLF